MSHPEQSLTPSCVALTDRTVLAVIGDDRVSFLQGLVSADVRTVSATRSVWSALLTPQGKYLFDFMIIADDASLLLEVEKSRAADLLKRLSLYRLRAKVTVQDVSDRFSVHALLGHRAATALDLPAESGATAARFDGFAFVDPRHPDLGARLLLPRHPAPTLPFPVAAPEAWDQLRLSLGIPDGSRDLVPDRSLLLESGFDELNGVAWEKGCWMGQELTARTRYRGLVRKRLLPVAVDGPLPAFGTPITHDGIAIGEVRSGRDGQALALLRLEALSDSETAQPTLIAGEARLTPSRPAWLRL